MSKQKTATLRSVPKPRKAEKISSDDLHVKIAEMPMRSSERGDGVADPYDPQDAITIVGTWTRTGAPSPIPVGAATVELTSGLSGIHELTGQTGAGPAVAGNRAPVARDEYASPDPGLSWF